jgi:phage-related protein
MPQTDIIFYSEDDGTAPALAWLDELRARQPRAFAKVRAKLELLAQMGYELRRPAADYLADGIYELRARWRRVNYRLLYFFHGENVAVLVRGLTKEKKVSAADLARAKRRKETFETDPERHTFEQ